MILFVKRSAYKQGDSDVMTFLFKKTLRDGKENPHDSVRGDSSFIIKVNYLSKRISIMATAALATDVPGPKIAATPAL